jgi:hypothetical protein
MHLITMDEYEVMGRAQVITEARRVVGEGPTYIVAGAKFRRATTTLMASQRVKALMIISWTSHA